MKFLDCMGTEIDKVSAKYKGRRATVVIGAQPIYTGVIESVSDGEIAIIGECTDTITGETFLARMSINQKDPDLIFAFEVNGNMKG